MVYVYECTDDKCKHRFEKFGQKIDSCAPSCEKCDKKTIKVPAISNFILKGDGWYKDGYTKKGN